MRSSRRSWHPHDPEAIDILNRLKPPSLSSGHLLGTDDVGRDLLSRLLFGARVSLFVGVTTILLGGLVGTLLGVLAGYHGGRLDGLIMRVVDIQLAFPSLLLAIAILAVLGSSVANVIPRPQHRQLGDLLPASPRAQTLTLREVEFVHASRAVGATTQRDSRPPHSAEHVWPPPGRGQFRVGGQHSQRGFRSGFSASGSPRRCRPGGACWAWGGDYLRLAWWVSTFPGIALMITVFGVNVLGDRLRDQLDPRTRSV